MASLITGLWQLAIALVIFSHISTSLPSLERHQRQIELKLMHRAGIIREYEKSYNLLQNLMDYKRSSKVASNFLDKNTDDLRSLEDKLIELKICLRFVQNLRASFPGPEGKGTVQMLSRSVCPLIAEMGEAASGAVAEENQE